MAPSVGSWPRNTVPSRSSNRQSCCCARVVTSGQLADPVFGVGHAVDVSGGGMDEPLQRVVTAVEDLPEPGRSNLAAILADVDQG